MAWLNMQRHVASVWRDGRESALKCKRLAFSFQGAREEGRLTYFACFPVAAVEWTDVIRIYRRRDTMVLLLPNAELIFCGN